jgi:hypothetical protein
VTRIDIRILFSAGVQRWVNDPVLRLEQKVWALENTLASDCRTEIRDGHAEGQLLYAAPAPRSTP